MSRANNQRRTIVVQVEYRQEVECSTCHEKHPARSVYTKAWTAYDSFSPFNELDIDPITQIEMARSILESQE